MSQFIVGFAFLPLKQVLCQVLFELVKRVEIAHGLGEIVIQGILFLFLDAMNLNRNSHFLAGIAGIVKAVGIGDSKLFVFVFREADQGGGQVRSITPFLDLSQFILDIFVLGQSVVANLLLDGYGDQVPQLRRTRYGVPGGVLVLKFFQGLVDLLLTDLHGFDFHAQAAIVT